MEADSKKEEPIKIYVSTYGGVFMANGQQFEDEINKKIMETLKELFDDEEDKGIS